MKTYEELSAMAAALEANTQRSAYETRAKSYQDIVDQAFGIDIRSPLQKQVAEFLEALEEVGLSNQ
ncbi:hypothetical protein [Variovorax sp. LG9.2]|uniref:hypothetical protein n=1 Tax=Variovorax sp. LG9.2 TaxID=3048626 RepID=UPI002B230E3B|nr:hypothetical protein [Variovorax sp. LG9.2]MEB0057294.1 hypothetical protein [Variovorax sp. LG9.2]